jgi:membrane-bound lytic murein transglycosylase A
MDTNKPEERARRLRDAFDIYYAGGEGEKAVVTGAYEPVLQGSLEKTARFRYPLYRVPPDVVVIPADKNKGKKAVGRMEKGSMVPYYSRADIDGKNRLAGQGLEIAWVDDPVELFYLHVQGSGKIALPDGREMNVGFAQSNGRAFKGPSACLLETGKIKPSQATYEKVKQYFRDHPHDLPLLYRNESYIFFRVIDNGPLGALNVPLTEERSIAADPSIFPRGGLAYLKTRKPVFDKDGHFQFWQSFGRFVFIQDAGGAIKGPGRVDLFCGSGDEAERTAGSYKEKGSVYFLVKKKK